MQQIVPVLKKSKKHYQLLVIIKQRQRNVFSSNVLRAYLLLNKATVICEILVLQLRKVVLEEVKLPGVRSDSDVPSSPGSEEASQNTSILNLALASLSINPTCLGP